MNVLPAPACAGKLSKCPLSGASIPKNVREINGVIVTCREFTVRFRATCLSCRLRRASTGKFTVPSSYIKYVYRNVSSRYLVDAYRFGGYEYRNPSGGKLVVTRFYHVLIDPRGHFTRLRCAAIQVLDVFMGLAKRTKPFIEFIEFLANYPTW